MHTAKTPYGWLALACLVATNLTAQGPFPPLVEPPTELELEGKVIWSDFFTANIDAAEAFYTGLFGWSVETLDVPGEDVRLLLLDGRPVAGLVQRDQVEGETSQGRWIHFQSVNSINKTLVAIERAGGDKFAGPFRLPDRGTAAFYTDVQGALGGILHSTAGDPADFRADYNEWFWFEIYGRDTDAQESFYRTVFGYEVAPRPDERDDDFKLMSSDGFARAGLAELPTDRPELRPAWLGFIRVKAIGPMLEKAVDLGGDVFLEPSADLYDGKLAIIRDPLGGVVAIAEWEPESEEASE